MLKAPISPDPRPPHSHIFFATSRFSGMRRTTEKQISPVISIRYLQTIDAKHAHQQHFSEIDMTDQRIETVDRAIEGLIAVLRAAGVDEFAIASGLLIGAFTVAQQSLDAADWARCLELGARIIRAPEHRTEQ